jgi:RNA polymerase sigma factor (sigma-70 family)
MSKLTKREKDRLISENYNFICSIATTEWKKNKWLDRDDFIQEASMCAFTELEKYDPDVAGFGAFIKRRIELHLGHFVRSNLRSEKRVETAAEIYQMISENREQCIEEKIDDKVSLDLFDDFPTVKKRLMGHTIVDMAKVEKVAPSTVYRRMQKEKGEMLKTQRKQKSDGGQ